MLQAFISSGINIIVRGWHFWMLLTCPGSDCFFPASEKIHLKYKSTTASPNAILSQIPSDSPADLLHGHAWHGLTACTVSTFPFIFPEHAYIFQARTWKFFWVIDCYSEALAWMLVLEQFVVSVATSSQ